jgi:hypothetical protein
MHFWCTVQEHGSPFQSAYPTLNQKVSAKDWLDILHEMGAGGGWTLELPRPGVEGLEDAVVLLQSSSVRPEAHDPVGAMSELRKAWDGADPILDGDAEWRDEAINGLSKGEEGRPSKAEPIRGIREAGDQLTQIGPHSHVYEVTGDDALLAYRVSASALVYLSKQVAAGIARHSR